ncbi:TRAP transporter substrate-binding protein [Desulfosudis oleivorans]|uniref:TRAP dicarboxylate transporter-DctP subunit n=1 Tax=Desulfosudis oleivorans (strain DSM 6200 / JCM 39069 / Hxd3) TaxID=96561 RepID=A8ZZK5_DESOH|nr:TRAP transporter substrate-binding protein DctP [Desulfosudis oleivorans]ABW68877.1 TRAP dicarboxylate transporter- DctP subunit [Desulfosudis oleivorans Hxd3]
MFMRDGRSRGAGLCVLVVLTLMLMLAGKPESGIAADADTNGVQQTVAESLEALWTGRTFSPELQQRQQAMKTLLQNGAVTRADLVSMMETAFLPMLDRAVTSRYILKAMARDFDAVFAPHMTWEDGREMMWRVSTSVVKKGDQVLIKIGTLAPPGTPWLSVPETITIPEIEKMTEGRVTVKIYGGGVMGEDTDILRKMDIGQLDGCGCTSLGVLAASPETSVFLVPGLFKSYDEVDYVYEKFRKRLDRAFEEKGYILAALIDTGFFHIFSKNRIAGLEDVKKQKMLTWFGIMETTLYNELGINPTPVAVPEVVSALSTGLANTNLAPAAWMLGMQAYQYANYYLTPALMYSPAAIVVSTKTKDRIQKQVGVSDNYAQNFQEIIVSEFNLIEGEWRRQIRVYDAKSLKAFETKCGMKAMTFSAEDQKLIEQAGIAVREKLAGKAYPADLLNEILAALEEFRKSHP